MAITVKKILGTEVAFDGTGITNGNEVICRVSADKTYSVQGIVTSAGSASVKYKNDGVVPTDFTNFVTDTAGSFSSNFSRIVSGQSYIGVDVASGTWNVTIQEI